MTEFRLLGPVELWAGGQPVDLGPVKRRAVLAALLVDAGRLVLMDTVIDRVWDETPPADARSTLYSYITRLRGVLAETGGADASPASIERRPGGYLLQVDPDQVDLHRFRRLVEQGRLAGDDEQQAASLREAIALWRGVPLAGLPGAWAERVRHNLEQQRLGAVLSWAQVELRLGHTGVVVEVLHELATHYPLAEPVAAQLMRALYLDGRGAEALDRYVKISQRIILDLGAQPGPELREVHQAILRGDLPRPGPASAPADAPVPAAPDRPAPAQLPADVPGFTGRVEYLQLLDGLVSERGETGAIVLSAVAGTAGVGKTALALRWAHRSRHRFTDGQLYVDLRGFAQAPPLPPIEALARMLHALGVPAEQVPVEVDEASGLYRTLLAGKRMLVLLDNARSAEQVRPLLPGSSSSAVVVTSRDRLGGLIARDGARSIVLDVLPPAEAVALLTTLLGAARVAAEPAATTELARLCAYLPLALRIAAANITTQPQHSIGAQVEELRAGNRLAALYVEGDQESMVRAAFDLSYVALGADAQRLFRLLGLVPGPDVTPAAAAALAGLPRARAVALLAKLTSANLIGQPSVRRYAFHDLLRSYAAERARQDETEPELAAALRRLHDYYLSTVDAAARCLYPENVRLPFPPRSDDPAVRSAVEEFSQQADALSWLDAERSNLIAALQHAAEHGPRQVAWLLADALRGYFWSRMYVVDWLSVAGAGLAAAEAGGDVQARAAAELSIADAYMMQSEFRRATEYYTRALADTRRVGWLAGQASSLGNLGNIHAESGRLEQAADCYRQALAISQEIGRLSGQGANLCNLGLVYVALGRLAEAADQFRQARALHREAGSRNGEAINLENLGEVEHLLGRFPAALESLTAALALHRELGNRGPEGETLRILAQVHRDAGRDEQALELGRAALTLARETGNHRHEASALNTLATVHSRRGQHADAVRCYRRALEIARETSNRHPEAVALVGLAAERSRVGEPAEALTEARQALALARQAGYRVLEGQVRTSIAEILLAHGRYQEAAAEAAAAGAVHEETGHRLGAAQASLVLADALDARRDSRDAATHRGTALRVLAEIGAVEPGPPARTA